MRCVYIHNGQGFLYKEQIVKSLPESIANGLSDNPMNMIQVVSNKDAEMKGLSLKNLAYLDNQNDVLFDLSDKISDAINNQNYSAIKEIADEYLVDDVIEEIIKANDLINAKKNEDLTWQERVLHDIELIREGERTILDQYEGAELASAMSEWLSNTYSSIQENIEILSEIDGRFNSLNETYALEEGEVNENDPQEEPSRMTRKEIEHALINADKAQGTVQLLKDVVSDIGLYNNKFTDFENYESVSDLILDIYEDMKDGHFLDLNLTGLTAIANLEEGRKEVDVASLTREDVINTINNARTINRYNLYQAYKVFAENNDDSIIRYFIAETFKGINTNDIIDANLNGNEAQEGGRTVYGNESRNVNSFMSNSLKQSMSSIFYDDLDTTKGTIPLNQVEALIKQVRLTVLEDGGVNVTFRDYINTLRGMLDSGKFSGNNRVVAQRVFEYFFSDDEQHINTNYEGIVIAPLYYFANHPNYILEAFEEANGEEMREDIRSNFNNKINSSQELINSLLQWMNSIDPVTVEIFDKDGSIVSYSPMSKPKSSVEVRNELQNYWGLNNISQSFNQSHKIAKAFEDVIHIEGDKITITKGNVSETYDVNYAGEKPYDDETLMDLLRHAMVSIGYTDASNYFTSLHDQFYTIRDGRRVLSEEQYRTEVLSVLNHLKIAHTYFEHNERILYAVEEIHKLGESYDQSLSPEDRIQIRKEMEDIHIRYDKNQDGVRQKTINARGFTFNLYIPTSQYEKFFDSYIEHTNKITHHKLSNTYTNPNGQQSPLLTITNSLSEHKNKAQIDAKYEGFNKPTIRVNPLVNGSMDLLGTSVLGGRISEHTGMMQDDMDTIDFLNMFLNGFVTRELRNKNKDNEVALLAMAKYVDRPNINIARAYYKPNGYNIYTYKNNKLEIDEKALLYGFIDVAKLYEAVRGEVIDKYNNLGLHVDETGAGLLLFDNRNELILESDKTKYWGLIRNSDYSIVELDGERYLAPGNSYNYTLATLPANLIGALLNEKISDANKIELINDLYMNQEVSKLLELVADEDVQIKNELSKIFPLIKEFHEDVESKIESKSDGFINKAIENIERTNKKIREGEIEGKEVNIAKKRKDYEDKINESRRLSDEVKSKRVLIGQEGSDVEVLQSEIEDRIERIKHLRKETSVFKKALAREIKKDTSRLDSNNNLFRYMISSHLFYNTFIDQLTRGGTSHASSVSDFAKRGQAVSSPFMSPNIENNSKINIIYRQDFEGEYMDSHNDSLHSDGEVMLSPLFMDRYIHDDGGRLSFATFDGQIKTNYFNPGMDTGLAPVHLKMSARTIAAHELKSRSKMAIENLKVFFDKDIHLFDRSDVVDSRVNRKSKTIKNSERINLYEIFKEDFAKVETQRDLRRIMRKMNKLIREKDKGMYAAESGRLQIVEGVANQSLNNSLYYLLPHVIAPTSAAKEFQQKVHDLSHLEESNEEQFGYVVNQLAPTGLAANAMSSMAVSSSAGFGIQNNKRHSTLPQRKAILNQILNFTGINTHTIHNSIMRALSGMTENAVAELAALTELGGAALLHKFQEIAYRNAVSANINQSRLDLLEHKGSNNVIQRELSQAIALEFKKAVKPDMVGGTFVQRASTYHVYEKDGVLSFADELGAKDDFQDVKGYNRRRLRPFGYKYNGKFIRSKEELTGILRDPNKAKDLTVSYQEVVMEFPYRHRFFINNKTSLRESMTINGENLQDGDTVLTESEIRTKLEKAIGGLELIEAITLLHDGLQESVASMELETTKDLTDHLTNYYLEYNQSLYLYASRIPTTGLASGFPSKIVGFAHGIENTIVVPSEKSILDGSDYDIDELHLIYKPFDVGWNRETVGLQNQVFENILETYHSLSNASDITTQIQYDDFVAEAEKLDKEMTEDVIHKFSNFFSSRKNSYEGRSLVGFEVIAQQALMNFYITNKQLQERGKGLSLPFLEQYTVDGDRESGNRGMSLAMDVLSSYINMATDNDKLNGALSQLGHTRYTSPLVLGLVMKGVPDTFTDHEDMRTVLNQRVYDVLTNEAVRDAIKQAEKSARSDTPDKDKINTANVIYANLEEAKNKYKDDKEYYQEIMEAYALGTQAYRLFSLNKMQDRVSSLFDLYNIRKNASKNLGMELSDFLNLENLKPEDQEVSVDKQMSFIGSSKGLELAVRESFNIVEYARLNPMVVSHINMIETQDKAISLVVPNYQILKDLEARHNDRYVNKKFNQFYEDGFNAMMNGIESMKITEFVRTSNKYGNVVMNLDIPTVDGIRQERLHLDLSQIRNLNKLNTLFPMFAEKLKKNNPANMFASNLSIRTMGGGKQFVTVRSAEAIDDPSHIQALQDSFSELSPSEQKAIMVYAFIKDGYSMRRNSLIRFIPNDIIMEFSKWDNSGESKVFDFDNLKASEVHNGLSANENLLVPIELTDRSLQVYANEKNKTPGFAAWKSTHNHRTAGTYTFGEGTLALMTPPYTKILAPADDAVTDMGRVMNLSTEQEAQLLLGYSVETDLGRTNRRNTSDPRVTPEGGMSNNISAFSEVTVKESGPRHIVKAPVIRDGIIDRQISSVENVALSLFNTSVTKASETGLTSAGNLLVVNHQEFMDKPITDIYGAIALLETSKMANDYFMDVKKIAEDMQSETLIVQAYEKLFGLTPNVNGVLSFLAKNHTLEKMKEAFSQASNVSRFTMNNIPLSTFQVNSLVESMFSNEHFNTFTAYVNETVNNYVDNLGLSDLAIRKHGSDGNITFKNIAEMINYDSHINSGITKFGNLGIDHLGLEIKEFQKQKENKDC